MNKLIITALLMCGIFFTASAGEESAPVKQPTSLISALNDLYEQCGKRLMTTKSSRSNPETGMLEEKSEIMIIQCDKNSNALQNAINAFEKDKDCGYQYMHISPFEQQGIEIFTNSGSITPRTELSQELWMLNVKNPDNPRLRDNYTLVLNNGEKFREGKIYLITSIRPDLKTSAESARSYWDAPTQLKNKKFIIEGSVDAAIADSCYNIYIANEHSAITDKDLVACVPVIDNKFYFETELDEMKEGRLRALFPGDELCSAWIDVNFIPGFTMKMTVHNGYYDIKNQEEYNQKVQQYLHAGVDNPGPIVLHDAQLVQNTDTKPYSDIITKPYSDVINEINYTETTKLQIALASYQCLLEDINLKIDNLKYSRDLPEDRDHMKELYKQSKEITEKMKKLIDEYAKNIK